MGAPSTKDGHRFPFDDVPIVLFGGGVGHGSFGFGDDLLRYDQDVAVGWTEGSQSFDQQAGAGHRRVEPRRCRSAGEIVMIIKLGDLEDPWANLVEAATSSIRVFAVWIRGRLSVFILAVAFVDDEVGEESRVGRRSTPAVSAP